MYLCPLIVGQQHELAVTVYLLVANHKERNEFAEIENLAMAPRTNTPNWHTRLLLNTGLPTTGTECIILTELK